MSDLKRIFHYQVDDFTEIGMDYSSRREFQFKVFWFDKYNWTILIGKIRIYKDTLPF